MLYEQNVQAGYPLQLNVPGRYFLLDSTGDESQVTVTLLRGGSPIFGQIPGARRGLKIGVEGGFDGVRIEAAGATTVRFFATFENVSISTTDGAAVSVPGGVEVTNGAGNPVVVDVQGATLTATDVELAQKPVTVAGAVYSVTSAGVSVSSAANKDRRAIHFRNASDTVDAYLAAFAAAAKDDCPIVLLPGEVLMVDDRSASAAWVAFSDGVDLSLIVQEVVE